MFSASGVVHSVVADQQIADDAVTRHRDWLAEVEQVLRRLTMPTAEHHDAQLVHDSFWYIE